MSGPTCFPGRAPFRPDHQHSFKRHHFIGNPGTNLFQTIDDTHLLPRQQDTLVKPPPQVNGHLYGGHHHHPTPLEPLCHPPPDAFYHAHHPPECDLESFAERFKQRRIKLGVTQADVGRALAHLKLPGVGALSQSTICRFESLTLSRSNMLALRPALRAWLDTAEAAARGVVSVAPPTNGNRRRRTAIAAAERRALESYFAVQQRPSGDKIAAIAQKLDLKKGVVRVWFCNQRQKQKRMKYSANRAN